MDEPIFNDNEPPSQARPATIDAPGQAAILLVESLIHGLLARAVISVSDAIEIVERAAEVNEDIAADRGGLPAPLQSPPTILSSIAASLRYDQPEQY